MGFKQIRTSDISGEVLDDDNLVTVIVKTEGKVFDAKRDELGGLKILNKDLVELELKYPDGTSEQIITNAVDFYKQVPKQVVNDADSSRGRRSGYRPS